MTCPLCYLPGHVEADCPDRASMLGYRPATEEPRSDADDAVDQLRERFLRTRAFAGQLLRLCREANVPIPLAILEINPDPTED